MGGLAPPNLRLVSPPAEPAPELPHIAVEVVDAADTPDIRDDGAIMRIVHGDGSVEISTDGRPLIEAEKAGPSGWFDNLVDDIDQMELGRISEDLLRGIDDDIASRKEWIEARATGIALLGLKVEVPGLQGASDGAPVEGMSKVRHPLLLEAVLRFQANARAELLPTDGPVKIRDDGKSTAEKDELADALQDDLNHYLTARATEYYPDTDRMLLLLGFGGTSFKKVYFCPLRMRPVSETVDATDLIVDNTATDLANAKRVTHRTLMKPSTVKRLQILGVYRDVDLSTPNQVSLDSAQRAAQAQQGVSQDSMRPEDRDREVYECYCELDIKGFEYRFKGRPAGLEIPYRVTIDVSSKHILSIVRDYDETERNQLPEKRTTFVKYTFVPGLGFLDIGLLHILGNSTNALTAAWREMLDNGMYANFPGFLIAKSATRQQTTILRVPPGGGAPVDTQGMSLKDAVMPLPYKTEGMAALMALVENMAETGQRIGGTSELQVGEGRADAPVGTTLAMIDQATKVMNSVHKRMHASQALEFKLIVQCFREHPESFWERGCASKTPWNVETFERALDSCELVPQADPNTASHAQRVMKILGLKQLQATNPSLYDPIAIDTAALRAMGWSNPEQFMASPESQAQPPPELMEIQAGIEAAQGKVAADTKRADAAMVIAQSRAAETRAKIASGGLAGKPQQTDTPVDVMTAHARLMDAETGKARLGLEERELHMEDQHRTADRAAEQHGAHIDRALDIAKDIAAPPPKPPVPARAKKPKA